MGESCTRECDSGWYGLNCEQKCSAYCNDTGACDHVTGSCKGGCKSGWQVEANVTGKIENVNSASTSDAPNVLISLFCISIVGSFLMAGYIIYLRRRMSQQPMVSNSQEDCEKSLTVESGNQKEKTYDTLGSNTSRADEKEEEIDMLLQTA